MEKGPWKVDDPLRGKSAPAKPPCQKCPDRHEACHDTCERYQAFRARRLEDYKRRAQAVDMANYTQDRVTKAKRRAGKKP